MPTSAAGPTRESHQARELAESFGADAERYDRTRPSYPEAMIQRVVTAAPGRDLVDVGCGTGIATRQFRAAGCAVLGVEVDERMAGPARRGGIDVEVSPFESWDTAGRTFDIVAAGQTWHWVDPVAGAAKAAEALRPGGVLALFWNVAVPPADLSAAFADVYRRVVPGFPVFDAARQGGGHSVFVDKATAGLRAVGAFAEPEESRFDWERPYTKEEWLDVVPTSGGHSRFPAETLSELLSGIGAVLDAHGGSFTMTYTTLLLTAVRAADPA
ncbi:class I SAM-dependent methyltransferase [Actinophytocola sp. NPDC049390]|uniref:class I SAM-dependent methyltransferase n=1 Tax=Actinophytocola sp. NPDC049390 TaxID=3363894 RepID=UPI003794F924